MADIFDFGAIEDGVAWVCAEAIGGRVFAAGVTFDVTSQTQLVVPLERDFLEVGGQPAVTCLIGSGTHLSMPNQSRMRINVDGTVWRDGVDFGASKNALLADLAKIHAAIVAHSKARLVAIGLQSAMFMSWSRPTARVVGGTEEAPGLYLTLPFVVEVVLQRTVEFQPA